MQCALTQLPALSVLVRVGILVMESTVLVRSSLVYVCVMGGQVKGNYSSIMLNGDAMTVQVQKHISAVLAWSLLTTAIGSEEANKQMCMPY